MFSTVDLNTIEILPQGLNYLQISPDHPLMCDVSSSMINIQEGKGSEHDLEVLRSNNVVVPEWEKQKGPCQSKALFCYIRDSSSEKYFIGSNGTNRHVDQCLRFVEKIDDFDPCKNVEICYQPAHAEVMAVVNFLLLTERVTIDDLHQIFPGSIRENGTLKFGVVSHHQLLEYINSKGVRIEEEVYLYGQEICCTECTKILLALGVTNIFISPQTHQDQYTRRNRIHNQSNLE